MFKNVRGYLSLVLSLVMIFCMFIANAFALEFVTDKTENYDEPSLKLSASTYAELTDAIKQANTAGGAVITLNSDITVTAAFPSITSEIIIKGEYMILRGSGYTKKFFSINSGAVLTLDGGVIIDGGNAWDFDFERYVTFLPKCDETVSQQEHDAWFIFPEGATKATEYMFVNNGTLNINNVTVRNNYADGSVGVVTSGSNSVTRLNGAHIHHIAANNGQGVIINEGGSGAEAYIEEGTVVEICHSGQNFGLFAVRNGSVLTMNGGELKNNPCWDSGGPIIGIYQANSVFNMKGGIICGNMCTNGSAATYGLSSVIYLHSSSTMNMTGGSICHNSGTYSGAIIARSGCAGIYITGGEIVDNISLSGQCVLTDEAAAHNDICGTKTKYYISGGKFTQEVNDMIPDGYGTAVEFVKNADGEDIVYYTVTQELVEIKGKDGKYHSISAAAAAAEDGDELIVLADHSVYRVPETISKNITVNLNGHTVYGWTDELINMFDITGNVTFTNGSADARRMADASVFTVGEVAGEAGKLTIKDGTYVAEGNIVTVEKGELYIEDGCYEVTPIDGMYMLDCNNANYQNDTADIVLSGGIYKDFNPANCDAEGEGTNFCAYIHDSVEYNGNNWRVVKFDPICKNVQKDILYKNVNSALNDAEAGETIQLIRSAIETDIVLPEGVSFDLNGFTLVADNVVGVRTTHVYDGANNAENGYKANGVLRVLGSLVLAEDNGAVPVYSPVDGGYIFVDFLFNQGQDKLGDVSRVNMLATSRTAKVITLLKDGASDNDIQIGVRLTVNGEKSVTFIFTEYAIKNVMNSNGGKFNLFDRMFYANFTGIEDFESVEATAVVIAHGNVIDSHKDVIVLK